MKLIGIKTNTGYLITDNVMNDHYFNTKLSNLLFDGKLAKNTHLRYWFRLDNKPTKIEKNVIGVKFNYRWELKDKSLKDKFREVYLNKEVYDYDNELLEFFEGIKGLYEFKFDTSENSVENIEFELNDILEIEEYTEPIGFSYKISNKEVINPTNVTYDLITKIINPELLIHNFPCKLTKLQTYNIIRNYIKDNIDGRVAEITSDYDFCFTVKKKVILANKYSYQKDINRHTRKKPKFETVYVDTKSVEVFQMCHKEYQQYTPVTEFIGNSLEDLKKNIDSFLEELITEINKPVHECDKCNGRGVILN